MRNFRRLREPFASHTGRPTDLVEARARIRRKPAFSKSPMGATSKLEQATARALRWRHQSPTKSEFHKSEDQLFCAKDNERKDLI